MAEVYGKGNILGREWRTRMKRQLEVHLNAILAIARKDVLDLLQSLAQQHAQNTQRQQAKSKGSVRFKSGCLREVDGD
jgi:hypothetical protein